ncbi:MAG: hypothetical protein ACI4S3_00285 [Candidatus Gastranaerophilaceae bacterium]
MKNLELESEAIRISKFCHVICQILFMHREMSITKLIFFAYVVKTKNEYLSSIFSSNNSKFLDDKIVSMLSGDFNNYCRNIDVIIKAIHILIVNQNCKMESDIISFISRKGYESEIYDDKSFIYKAIEYSKTVEDFQFLKEIVQNV